MLLSDQKEVGDCTGHKVVNTFHSNWVFVDKSVPSFFNAHDDGESNTNKMRVRMYLSTCTTSLSSNATSQNPETQTQPNVYQFTADHFQVKHLRLGVPWDQVHM